MTNEQLIHQLVTQGILSIDDQGRVWRNGRRAESKSSNGYLNVKATVRGSRITVSAHRLVYFHFRGEIKNGLVVHHKNDDKWDNRPENLEAVTHSENARLAYASGAWKLRGCCKPKLELVKG